MQKTGVVHIGVGNFHRAHQALYFHRLAESSPRPSWFIQGVNLRPESAGLVKQLQRRQGRYYLKTISAEGVVAWEEIQALQALVDWTQNPEEAEALLVRTPFVTITVTEAGYYTHESARLNATHPLIRQEIETKKNHGSIFGFLRAGLLRRRRVHQEGLTLICCDNIVHNGAMLEAHFQHYLELLGEDALREWVQKSVSFPNTMVDRITPRPPAGLSQETRLKFGVAEDATVLSEAYIQWVLEDKFSNTRPPLEAVGVQLVSDVTPFEDLKLRVLNGGHIAVAYMGALKGYPCIDQAMRDPDIASFFDDFQQQEVLPGLRRLHDFSKITDIDAYCATIRARFSNSHIVDSIERVAMDGASKIGNFILPTLRDALERGQNPQYSFKILASWYHFLEKYERGLLDFSYQDPLYQTIRSELRQDFAKAPSLWGDLPSRYPHFADGLREAIKDFQI